jgi:hypothetical protein
MSKFTGKSAMDWSGSDMGSEGFQELIYDGTQPIGVVMIRLLFFYTSFGCLCSFFALSRMRSQCHEWLLAESTHCSVDEFWSVWRIRSIYWLVEVFIYMAFTRYITA